MASRTQHLISAVCIWILGDVTASASVFPLKEDIIGISQMKTECATNSTQARIIAKRKLHINLPYIQVANSAN